MKNLCRAIIWSACFLEMSDEDSVHPDDAIRALEDMASTLQQATEEEKQAFAAAWAEEAADLLNDPGNEQTAAFVRGLPEALGL